MDPELIGEMKSISILLPDGEVLQIFFNGEIPDFSNTKFLAAWILKPDEYIKNLNL
jgi:hypothetical protein